MKDFAKRNGGDLDYVLFDAYNFKLSKKHILVMNWEFFNILGTVNIQKTCTSSCIIKFTYQLSSLS